MAIRRDRVNILVSMVNNFNSNPITAHTERNIAKFCFVNSAMQKMAKRHNKEGGNHLEQESNRQKAMEDIDGGLHPAVHGQSLGEGESEFKYIKRSISFCRQSKKSKVQLPSECVQAKHGEPCLSFTSNPHSLCSMVWYRT